MILINLWSKRAEICWDLHLLIGREAKTGGGRGFLKRINNVLQGNYCRRGHYRFLRQSTVNLLRWRQRERLLPLVKKTRRNLRVQGPQFHQESPICSHFQFSGSHFFIINILTLIADILWAWKFKVRCNSATHKMRLGLVFRNISSSATGDKASF